jgi:hypothetical protein
MDDPGDTQARQGTRARVRCRTWNRHVVVNSRTFDYSPNLFSIGSLHLLYEPKYEGATLTGLDL